MTEFEKQILQMLTVIANGQLILMHIGMRKAGMAESVELQQQAVAEMIQKTRESDPEEPASGPLFLSR